MTRPRPAPSRLLSVTLLLTTAFPAFAQTYSITDLGTLGNAFTVARDINNAGQVVGESSPPGPFTFNAMRWENGSMFDLGTLPGDTRSIAHAINNRGQIVGQSGLFPNVRGFLWEEGAMLPIGNLGLDPTIATDINERGQVVGNSRNASNVTTAFLWDRGVMTALVAPGATLPLANGINSSGRVVGQGTFTAVAGLRAYLWDKGTATNLGVLPGHAQSDARAINNRGQVVGLSADNNPPATISGRPFLWDRGTMIDLGALPGTNFCLATDINNSGHVVGIANVSNLLPGRAFLWDKQNGLRDLNDLIPPGSGWAVLQTAQGINEAGQIVGTGRITVAPGELHAFVLTRN